MVFTCEMLVAAKGISVDLNLYSNLSIQFSDLERTQYHKHKLNTRGMKIDQNCVKPNKCVIGKYFLSCPRQKMHV